MGKQMELILLNKMALKILCKCVLHSSFHNNFVYLLSGSVSHPAMGSRTIPTHTKKTNVAFPSHPCTIKSAASQHNIIDISLGLSATRNNLPLCSLSTPLDVSGILFLFLVEKRFFSHIIPPDHSFPSLHASQLPLNEKKEKERKEHDRPLLGVVVEKVYCV